MRINSVLIRTIGHGWLLIFLFVSGCGFQLRGEMPISEKFANVYIKTNEPYSKFSKALSNALSYSHIAVVPESQSNYILEILEYSETQHIAGYDPKSKLGSFLISAKVTYSLSANDKPLCLPKTIIRNQSIGGSINHRFGIQTQGEYLYESMRQDIIQSILYQLSSREIQSLL
jgi:LPS-assembly lipoprotein